MRRSQIRKSVATRGWLWHREPRIGIQGNMHTTSNSRYFTIALLGNELKIANADLRSLQNELRVEAKVRNEESNAADRFTGKRTAWHRTYL